MASQTFTELPVRITGGNGELALMLQAFLAGLKIASPTHTLHLPGGLAVQQPPLAPGGAST